MSATHLTEAERIQFVDGLIAERRRGIENKAIPAGIVAWMLTAILVARFNVILALVLGLVVGAAVFNVVKTTLEHKHLGSIIDYSDAMLVARYNEAKADRRAARTRSAIGWAVIAIVGVIVTLAWVAARLPR